MKYTFIDIGCSHFSVSVDTFGLDVNGLLIEPIKEYCNVLPHSKTVQIENSAIGTERGIASFNACIPENLKYFTSQEMNEIIDDPVKQHEFVNQYGGSGLSSFLNSDKLDISKETLNIINVNVITLQDLVEKYNITEIDYLKIDVEGFESIVLEQLVVLLDNNIIKINKEIRFEYNRLGSDTKEEMDNAYLHICEKYGFTAKFINDRWDLDMVLTKQPTNNKFLVFTNVGDDNHQCLSWCVSKSNMFDRAINYVGDNVETYNRFISLKTESITNFPTNDFNTIVYDHPILQEYDCVVVIDSNVIYDTSNLEDLFINIDYKKFKKSTYNNIQTL
jgi:FkbM family methyltransferase